MLSERETLLMAHLLNFSKLIHTFKRYWTMHWSLASYSPWIFLTTSWESLHIASLDADKVWARLSPTRIASYLASLLEVGNLSRIAYSSRYSVGDCKRKEAHSGSWGVGCSVDVQYPPLIFERVCILMRFLRCFSYKVSHDLPLHCQPKLILDFILNLFNGPPHQSPG